MLSRYFIVTLLVLLPACSPFAQPKIELPPLPETYQQRPAEAAVNLPDHWWESFAESQLNQLQQEMLTSNFDLRQALHRLEQLEALQRASGASLWPALTLSGSINREKSPGNNSPTIATSERASLAASYEIDLWNRLHDKADATRLRREAGRLETQALLLSLSAQLAEQYFTAAEQRAQLQLVEGQIGHYNELITTIGNRYKSGLATARELYQARQNLARAEALLPQYRTGVVRAENSIALLLGRFPQAQLTQIDKLPELTSAVAAGLPASLLTQRPDVAAALTNLQAADRDLAAALADRLPSIDLSATAYYSATQLARGDIEGTFWSLALGLTQPLFDGGRRQAESDRQRALSNEQSAKYQQTLLTAVQEVETALVADQNSALRQQRLQQQLQASHQELLHSLDNYRHGLLSSQDLLASEIRYLETSSQTISGQRQWLSHRISLARALGGTWMAEELNQRQQTQNRTEDQQ
jgi:NodT family efflux transporter outer membrane factor (OMF) lipoprotein